MTFKISRASDWRKKNKPCEEAHEITIVNEFDTIDKHVRIEKKQWVIDIASLDDLMALVSKYGSIIIDEYHESDETPQCNEITIYDDYIE